MESKIADLRYSIDFPGKQGPISCYLFFARFGYTFARLAQLSH